MCAIFGFAGFNEEHLIDRMQRRLVQRGPDGFGVFRDDGITIANRRLSIIGGQSGRQPMVSENGDFVLSFSGEVYNFMELRRELEAHGCHFRTSSDTEVVLHAHSVWGEKAVQRFNGMFAFSLYDRRKNELVLVRDPCGQKPLYYWENSGKLIFASEIKAILQSDHVERRVEHRALDQFLLLRYVPEPFTMFAGIRSLQAGHRMVWKNGESRIERHWKVPLRDPARKARLRAGEWEHRLDNTLNTSIQRHLRADHPCGAYLSSGVDSALMTALMARHSQERISTFSIGFGSSIDETEGAREIAAILGTDHHECRLENNDFNSLPEVVHQMDRPVGDALILAFDKLARMAGSHRKVMLGGEGADEIFGGYPFHKILGLTECFHRLLPRLLRNRVAVPFLASIPHQCLDTFFKFPAPLGSNGKELLLDFLSGYEKRSLTQNAHALRTLWRHQERGSLYTDEFRLICSEERLRESSSPGDFTDRMLASQWEEWIQDWALIRQEKNNMAHGIEFRAPFLDHELIDLGFAMPSSLKISGSRDKHIFRKVASRYLPPRIAHRKKIPFYFPLKKFLESRELLDLIELTLNRSQIQRRGYFRWEKVQSLRARVKEQPNEFLPAKQLLSLVILELWHMSFIDAKPDHFPAIAPATEVMEGVPCRP